MTAVLTQQPRHQYDEPRPGRSYCAVVDYDCLAPAGLSTGAGYASLSGVRRTDLHTCAYCGEPVCERCSTEIKGQRYCTGMHRQDDLDEWVALAERRR